jgi:hypothetical protein
MTFKKRTANQRLWLFSMGDGRGPVWIVALTAQVRAPADRAEELERRLGHDSSNSGRPPSPNSISDEDETKTMAWDRSSRRRGVRMPGEQPGATSITLPLVDAPYGTISCPPAERAGRGGGSGRSVNVR